MTRHIFTCAGRVLLISVLTPVLSAYAQPVERRYTYREFDGIFVFYETEEDDAYRRLLPRVFDVPDRLLVHAFIADYYKMDARTQPYKEGAIFLLAKHEGREVWHCITMPVTSDEARRLGIALLGFPKVMGQIELRRDVPLYSGTVSVAGPRTMSIHLDTTDHATGQEERLLKELTTIPKVNLRRGRAVEIGGRAPRRRSPLDLAKLFPQRVKLETGRAEIAFQSERIDVPGPKTSHPFDLTPKIVLLGYYFESKLQFSLRGRPAR